MTRPLGSAMPDDRLYDGALSRLHARDEWDAGIIRTYVGELRAALALIPAPAPRSGDGDPTPPLPAKDREWWEKYAASMAESPHDIPALRLWRAFVAVESGLASQRAARARAEQPDMQATIHDCLEVCAARGWSLHWTARGAYLHLESSELIEAWRGKGTSTVAEEAGDVLLVLFSILGAANVPWADALGCARAKLDDLRTRPRYPGEEFTAPPAGQPEAVSRDA